MKCLFCNRPKDWQSDISIEVRGTKQLQVTVCPKCRKEHNVSELYTVAIVKEMEKAKKILEQVQSK